MTHSASLVLSCLCVLVGLFQNSLCQRQLCGRALADTLDLVCAGRGFHLGKRNGRSVGMVYGKTHTFPFVKSLRKGKTQDESMDSLPSENPGKSSGFPKTTVTSADDLGSSKSTTKGEQLGIVSRSKRNIQSRGIVDECCIQACTFSTLESYCAEPDDPEDLLNVSEIRRLMSFSNRRPSPRPLGASSSSQGDSGYRPPSAEINRGQSNGQSNSFFYLSLDQQATRSPLLQKRQH